MVKRNLQILFIILFAQTLQALPYEIKPLPLIEDQPAQLIIKEQGVSAVTIVNKSLINDVIWSTRLIERNKDKYGTVKFTETIYNFTPNKVGHLLIPQLQLRANGKQSYVPPQRFTVNKALNTSRLLDNRIIMKQKSGKDNHTVNSVIKISSQIFLNKNLKIKNPEVQSISCETADILSFSQHKVSSEIIELEVLLRPTLAKPVIIQTIITGKLTVPLKRVEKQLTIDIRFLNDYEDPVAHKRTISFSHILLSNLDLTITKPPAQKVLQGIHEIAFSISKEICNADEPLILTAQLKGTNIYPPNMGITPTIPGFTVYPPQCHLGGPNIVESSATLEWVLIPQKTGKQTIEVILKNYHNQKINEFSYTKEINVIKSSQSISESDTPMIITPLVIIMMLFCANVWYLVKIWLELKRKKQKPQLQAMLSAYSHKKELLSQLSSTQTLPRKLILQSLEYIRILNNMPDGSSPHQIISLCLGGDNLKSIIDEVLFSPLQSQHHKDLQSFLIQEIMRF